MKKDLLLIGASGHGKVCADIASRLDKWQRIYFIDDSEAIKTCNGHQVIGKIADVLAYRDSVEIFVSIGNNEVRSKLQDEFESQGMTIATLIHPSAIICNNVIIGRGTVIMPGVVINSLARIGKGCIINTASSIDHDNVISDYVHISPGVNLAGTVTVGEKTWLGIGSSVSNNITICGNCIIGAGTVVIHDIEQPGTYVGLPAKRIQLKGV